MTRRVGTTGGGSVGDEDVDEDEDELLLRVVVVVVVVVSPLVASRSIVLYTVKTRVYDFKLGASRFDCHDFSLRLTFPQRRRISLCSFRLHFLHLSLHDRSPRLFSRSKVLNACVARRFYSRTIEGDASEVKHDEMPSDIYALSI